MGHKYFTQDLRLNMSSRIRAYKMHKPIMTELHHRGVFKLPKIYERLSADRIIGLDTESFQNRDYGAEWRKRLARYDGGLRTNLIPLDFADPSRNVVLETREYEHPITPVLRHLWSLADPELYPSWTKQRPKRERTDGNHRDGRRQWVEPVVLIMFNLGYDLGRLVRNHPQFRRAITSTMDSIKVQIDEFEIEVAQLTPSGTAASFEFYVRYDGKIMRLIGRDAWAYIKSTLDEAAECFLNEQKDELDKATFNRLWEELTESELARLKEYAAKDARLTRELYEMLITLLTSIDKHVICKNGILPKSAAGAAAKMMFSMASREEWSRPPHYTMEMGALAYSGGRVFNRMQGYYENINVFDVDSMHMFNMAQLPDPCTCEYIDIEPGVYNHKQWRGQYGVMLIDGEGLDQYYPALRDHDEKNQRPRYIYGSFPKILATIPEIVIGVESGRLRVDHVYGGIWMKGSSKDSFLRRFALKMYDLKQQYAKGTPMYILAKLLGNAAAGKLAEVLMDRPFIETSSCGVMLPDVPQVRSKQFYKQLQEVYIQGGENGLENSLGELTKQYPDAKKTISVREVIEHNIPNIGKAGAYYLPMHASQITGMASARLGLAAACTNAISGHTDSLFVIGDQSEGFKKFHEIERAAGYESPETGMGSFRQEVSDGWGILLEGNLYAIKYTDKETGEVIPKCATHGLPSIDTSKTTEYDMIAHLYERGYVSYNTRPLPMSLRLASIQHKEPGVFESHTTSRGTDYNPNMDTNDYGERVWRPYQDGYTGVPSKHTQSAIPPDIDNQNGKTVITWSQYQQLLKDSSDSLNQDTIPPDIESSSLQDATRKRSNSGLNITPPSLVGVKSPRENVSRLKKENTLPSTTALNGSMRSYTNDRRLSESACKNPQAGSSPST